MTASPTSIDGEKNAPRETPDPPTGRLNDDETNPTTEGSGAMPSGPQGDEADPGSE